ncbi:MAG: CoA transferase [Chloroflexi bacterium]|nr:CoA transferase [Chloroflexota bacterium]MDA1001978.1 CoA transferase [Chloroflexota bacterium]
MPSPLYGMTVLDISEGIAGPFCAKLLGDLGADVCKVEPPGRGDRTRQRGPFRDGIANPEASASYLYFNTSKRGVTLDLTDASDRERFARLLQRFDVVIAGETEGELAARGLGFDQLRLWNPRVILTTVSGFGSTGPHAGYRWSHLIACATGGWSNACGTRDREPLQAGGAIAETFAGAFAATATLLAAHGRASHGGGEHVDVSAQESALTAALFPTLAYEYRGAIAERHSATGPGPSFMLPTLDGYIGVNVLTQAQWDLQCQFFDCADMLDDPRFAAGARNLHAEEARARFAPKVADRSAEEVFHDGQVWRVPFGLVPDLRAIRGMLPHQEREFFIAIDHPVAGTVELPGTWFKSTATQPAITRAPLLGEHNDQLLGETATDNDAPQVAVTDATSASSANPPPLEGVRIVDLSMFMSGPMAMQICADAGAEVVKVESLQRIDGWRGGGGGPGDAPWEQSLTFNWVNRNKTGITLDLTDARGVALVKRLIADADVVIENYTPRVMPNFGLTYDVLREIKPDLIMISMPGFGLDVSWRDYVAFGMSTEQMSGMSHLTGYDDGPPLFTTTSGGDPFVGVLAATTILAALQHRRRTGEGQHVDLSQIETCTMYIGEMLAGWSLAGEDPGRVGNRHPTAAPHNTYLCADDRWIAIACEDDGEWSALASLIGHAEWATDGSPYANAAGRRTALNTLDAAIAAWTRPHGHIELMHRLQRAGVTAGAVMNGPELLADPHLAARDAFIPQDRPGVGVKHYPGQPYRFAFAPPPPTRRSPLLGEHTRDVLCGRLGVSDEEYAALERDDVVGTIPIAARGGER